MMINQISDSLISGNFLSDDHFSELPDFFGHPNPPKPESWTEDAASKVAKQLLP